jgi:hypothetical protein
VCALFSACLNRFSVVPLEFPIAQGLKLTFFTFSRDTTCALNHGLLQDPAGLRVAESLIHSIHASRFAVLEELHRLSFRQHCLQFDSVSVQLSQQRMTCFAGPAQVQSELLLTQRVVLSRLLIAATTNHLFVFCCCRCRRFCRLNRIGRGRTSVRSRFHDRRRNRTLAAPLPRQLHPVSQSPWPWDTFCTGKPAFETLKLTGNGET